MAEETRSALEVFENTYQAALYPHVLTMSVQRLGKQTKGAWNSLGFACTFACKGRSFDVTYSVGLGIPEQWLRGHMNEARTKVNEAQRKRGSLKRITDKDADLLLSMPSFRKSVDGKPMWDALCDQYEPSTSDVLASIFMDSDGIEQYEDWLAWAEEFGMIGDVASLREAQKNFDQARSRALVLRSWFGGMFDELCRLAREL